MAPQATFDQIPDKPSFPQEEEKVISYWREIDAFKESVKQSKGRPPYNFYDGPPFATGLPHYGHILAGTIKDVVCRHAHQRGWHVERRFGWDCHGVPVEQIIDAKLKITGRADVLSFGIDKYNEECRSIVQMYVQQWREIVERFGRWVDFDDDYKTMDLSFMESIWWVFKELFKKGLVYRAFRVMAYSTALCTPLSNFETAQNYKEVSDPSIIVQFKLKSKDNAYILAWTTTPWTLPSNLALCVHPEMTYLRLKQKFGDNSECIVGKDRFEWVCSSIKKDPKKDFDLLEEVKGATLKGLAYEPLFPYFRAKVEAEGRLDKVWHVVTDTYVTDKAGTCVVHQAPAFGEDDYRVCCTFGIIDKDGSGMVHPVDESGRFTSDVVDFKGQHVKDADKNIKEKLKKEGKLVYNGTEVHNYPHCWRSETPLIYRAIPAWFIKVEEERHKIINNNNQTYWVPSFVKEKRFHNWLVEARDWCVSRSRYWGTPIPLWVSEDFEEVVCIGSVAELEQYAGRKITDIHRHFIDDITIPSKRDPKKVLKRVDEVFDCWFESGSMPYSSKHYPFENKDEFEKGFPAHFIAEGLDQTRGWFYTLMVLSTHVFDKPAFKNLICNGLVLAADGKKMSKRLKNYPDPIDMANKYGADAVRMYMCNSPVVRAEPLKFKESGLEVITKTVFLPWYNAYRFFIQNVTTYEADTGKFAPDAGRIKRSTNITDKWINASLHQLIKFVRDEMDAYRLYTVVGGLTKFLDDLTNGYVRFNRDRMRGLNGADDALTALCTLYELLLNLTVLLAPVTPFLTETIYQNLANALPAGHPMKQKSVHWVMVPDFDPEALDPEIQEAVERMQAVIELGRTLRERQKTNLKMPLKSMTIFNKDEVYIKDLKRLEDYVRSELVVEEVKYSTELSKISLSGVLNFKALGKKLGKDMKAVKEAAESLSQDELLAFESSGSITLCGHEISGEEMSLNRGVKDMDDPNMHPIADPKTMLMMDFTFEEGLYQKYLSNEVANRVQKLRKEALLQFEDPVDVWAAVVPNGKKEPKLAATLAAQAAYIDKRLRRRLFNGDLRQGHELVIKAEDYTIEGEKVQVVITSRSAFFNQAELKKLTSGDPSAAKVIQNYAATFDLPALTAASKTGALQVGYGGKTYKVEYKKHYALGPGEASWLP